MTGSADIDSSREALFMEGACLDFGGGAGVFDLTFAVPRGAILGLIGPSGCGKTTTIRLLNGTLAPTAGECRVLDKRPRDFADADKARIGYIPQQVVLYPNLSADENLHFLGAIYGMGRAKRAARIRPLLDFVELTDARRRLARQLSGGMQRRLMLAAALLHDPEVLIADEPTAGIDPILRARIWDNFRELRDRGKTLLVSTQYVGEAAYCDRVAVMRRGRLVNVDTPVGLRRQAMGGEVIHLQVEPERSREARAILESMPNIHQVESLAEEPGGLHVFVDDAAAELPVVLAGLREQKDLTPAVAEPYLPPFDDVFVRLIQRAARERGEEQV
jgi:ABC-2 type transport system ATP-binding protein